MMPELLNIKKDDSLDPEVIGGNLANAAKTTGAGTVLAVGVLHGAGAATAEVSPVEQTVNADGDPVLHVTIDEDGTIYQATEALNDEAEERGYDVQASDAQVADVNNINDVTRVKEGTDISLTYTGSDPVADRHSTTQRITVKEGTTTLWGTAREYDPAGDGEKVTNREVELIADATGIDVDTALQPGATLIVPAPGESVSPQHTEPAQSSEASEPKPVPPAQIPQTPPTQTETPSLPGNQLPPAGSQEQQIAWFDQNVHVTPEDFRSFQIDLSRMGVFNDELGNEFIRPTTFIIHWTGGNYSGGVDQFVSAIKGRDGNCCNVQFYIDKSGKVWQFMPDNEMAAHARGANSWSTGVEIEATGLGDYNLAQMKAAVLLYRHLDGLPTNDINLDNPDSIRAHSEVTPGKIDPPAGLVDVLYNKAKGLAWEMYVQNQPKPQPKPETKKQPHTPNKSDNEHKEDKVETEMREPTREEVLATLSPEYHEVLKQKPTFEYAKNNHDSANGQDYGPRLSAEDITKLAYAAGFRGEDLVIAVALATHAEGGGAPYVINSAASRPGDPAWAVGLMQMLYSPKFAGETWRDPEANLDPLKNFDNAFILFTERGWDQWEAFTKEMHKPYMDESRQVVARVIAELAKR
jgi:hypothetical protein